MFLSDARVKGSESFQEDMQKALFLASEKNHASCVRLLCKELDFSGGFNGGDSFVIAASKNCVEALRVLLDEGVDLGVKNFAGLSAFHIAVLEKGNIEVLNLLLEQEKAKEVLEYKYEGKDAFSSALGFGKLYTHPYIRAFLKFYLRQEGGLSILGVQWARALSYPKYNVFSLFLEGGGLDFLLSKKTIETVVMSHPFHVVQKLLKRFPLETITSLWGLSIMDLYESSRGSPYVGVKEFFGEKKKEEDKIRRAKIRIEEEKKEKERKEKKEKKERIKKEREKIRAKEKEEEKIRETIKKERKKQDIKILVSFKNDFFRIFLESSEEVKDYGKFLKHEKRKPAKLRNLFKNKKEPETYVRSRLANLKGNLRVQMKIKLDLLRDIKDVEKVDLFVPPVFKKSLKKGSSELCNYLDSLNISREDFLSSCEAFSGEEDFFVYLKGSLAVIVEGSRIAINSEGELELYVKILCTRSGTQIGEKEISLGPLSFLLSDAPREEQRKSGVEEVVFVLSCDDSDSAAAGVGVDVDASKEKGERKKQREEQRERLGMDFWFKSLAGGGEMVKRSQDCTLALEGFLSLDDANLVLEDLLRNLPRANQNAFRTLFKDMLTEPTLGKSKFKGTDGITELEYYHTSKGNPKVASSKASLFWLFRGEW